MTIWDRIKAGTFDALARIMGPWPLTSPDASLAFSRSSSSGADVDADSALSLSAIFSGVMLLSRVTAMLPLQVRRREHRWGRNASVEATSNPAHWILGTEFNPHMTAVMGRRVMDFHRLLWGNAYGRIAWDGAGRAAGIWPVPAWRCRPSWDDDGTLHYLIDGGERVEAADMIHVPLVSLDGVTGRSFIDWAFESLGMSISAQEFAARFFGNDAQPGVVLTHPGTPKKEARDEFRRTWNESHQGPKNARRTAVLWGGWTIQPGGMISPEDAQLLESRRFGIEEVARWLSIPPHLLRDLSRATFSNIEHQGIDFVIYSIGPTLREYEQEYDRKLLSPPDVYSKHNVNALLRGDHASRSAYYTSMANIGVLSINDIRELEDLPPVEGGDKYRVPLNFTTTDAPPPPAAAPPPTPAPPTPPAEVPALNAQDREALRALLAHTLERMGKVERNALQRAAEKPGKLFAWMDEFYPAHEARLCEALSPVAAVVGGINPAGLAGSWCETSRQEILDATDGPADCFRVRAGDLLAAWVSRPAYAAQEIIPCPE